MQLFVSFGDSGFSDVIFEATADSLVKEASHAAADEWGISADFLELSFEGTRLPATNTLMSHGLKSDSLLEASVIEVFGKEWFTNTDRMKKLVQHAVSSKVNFIHLDTPTFVEDGTLCFDSQWVQSTMSFSDSDFVVSISDNFLDHSKVTNVSFSRLQYVTSIGSDFLRGCKSLTSFDISGLSKVVSLGNHCLASCSSLLTLDISGLTSVTTIGKSFLARSSLSSLDLLHFSNITSFGELFLADCRFLTTLDLSNFNNVVSVSDNFLCDCSSLTTLNISGFNNVLVVGDYFLRNCFSLSNLNLCNFKNVTRIGGYFLCNCSSLTTIDLTSLTNVNYIGFGFLNGCSSISASERKRHLATARKLGFNHYDGGVFREPTGEGVSHLTMTRVGGFNNLNPQSVNDTIQPRRATSFTLSAEILGSQPASVLSPSTERMKNQYYLELSAEEECSTKRRRSQDLPSCKISWAEKNPSVQLVDPGNSPMINGNPGSMLLNTVAKRRQGSDIGTINGRGLRDLVTRKFYSLKGIRDINADGMILAAVSNHDTSYGSTLCDVVYNSSVSISDVSRRSETVLAQIHFSSLLLDHSMSPSLELLLGFLSGDVLVYYIPTGTFTVRISSPFKSPSGSRLTHGHDEIGCSCVAWFNSNIFLAGHQNGILYKHSQQNVNYEAIKPDTQPLGGGSSASSDAGHGSGVGFLPSAGAASSASLRSACNTSATVSFSPHPYSTTAKMGKPNCNPLAAIKLSDSELLSCTISSLGLAAITCRDGYCYVVEVSTMTLKMRFSSKFGSALCSMWTPCGRFLCVGGQDDTISLYSTDPPQRLANLVGAENWISCIDVTAVKPDGGIAIFAASMDGRLLIWDVDAKGLLDEYIESQAPALSPTQVQFTDTLSSALIADDKGLITIPTTTWRSRHLVPDIDVTSSVEKLHGVSPLFSVSLIPSGAILTGCSHGILRVWCPKQHGSGNTSDQTNSQQTAPRVLSSLPKSKSSQFSGSSR